MSFEIGDKVLTRTGLYVSGEWREEGLKGKVVDTSNDFGGLLTVKFKGIEELRFIRPEYLIIREKKVEVDRPFEVGDSVVFTKDVVTGGLTVEVTEGIWAEVIELIPDSNLVVVEFDDGGELTVAEEVLASEGEFFSGEGEQADPDFEEDSGSGEVEAKESPEVLEALALVLERIEEIKTLLTTQPKSEVHFTVYPSAGLTEEEVAEAVQEEEPAPEPIFKKAKEVNIGDLLYTEAGAYDKVHRSETKSSGYTSLYGAFGNRIAQIPSGRVVQVLEEVS